MFLFVENITTKPIYSVSIYPDENLVVSDTWYDVEIGHRAGVHTRGVTYGNGISENLINDCPTF